MLMPKRAGHLGESDLERRTRDAIELGLRADEMKRAMDVCVALDRARARAGDEVSSS